MANYTRNGNVGKTKIFLNDVGHVVGNSKLKNKQVSPGSRVRSIIVKLANDRANKLEATPFKGLNSDIEQILYQSDIERLRIRLGKELSLYGKKAIAIFPYKDTYLVDLFDVITSKSVGIWELEATLSNGMEFKRDGVEYSVLFRYYMEDGKAKMESYFNCLDNKGKENGEKEVIEVIELGEMDSIPVEIFYANADRVPDTTYAGVDEDLARLNEIDKEMLEQWNLSKTMPFYNEAFTDNDPAQETAELKKGRGYLKENSMSSQLGAGTQLIPASAATTIFQTNILFLEDDIYKKLGLKRDLSSSNNSHTVEVITSDETTIENTNTIRQMREAHWNHLFEKIAMVLGVTQSKVELELSLVDKAKWDWFKAQMEQEASKNNNETLEETPKEDVEDPEMEDKPKEDKETPKEDTEDKDEIKSKDK